MAGERDGRGARSHTASDAGEWLGASFVPTLAALDRRSAILSVTYSNRLDRAAVDAARDRTSRDPRYSRRWVRSRPHRGRTRRPSR